MNTCRNLLVKGQDMKMSIISIYFLNLFLKRQRSFELVSHKNYHLVFIMIFSYI